MQSTKIPFYLPGLRSKYMQIELLTFLFTHKCEVASFLRSLSHQSLAFYDLCQEEITCLFEVFTISLRPPLKFTYQSETASVCQHQMSTRLLNFDRLRRLDHFDEHFQIAIELIVEDFEVDRHFLVEELKQPTCDILF